MTIDRLERDFEKEMYEIYRKARKECKYTPRFFMEMLADHGGLETARRLLSASEVQYGFSKLWECDRLDLTVEALVIDDRFSSLFDEATLNRARKRLRDHGYKFNI